MRPDRPRDVLEALQALIADHARVIARLAAAEERLWDIENEQAASLRLAYRRGYTTGYWAKRRGQACLTNPEVHARGKVRELLGVEA